MVSYLSIQLWPPRAGPTSCPNALLDNKDPSVQEAERRGGSEGSCKYSTAGNVDYSSLDHVSVSHMTETLNVKA